MLPTPTKWSSSFRINVDKMNRKKKKLFLWDHLPNELKQQCVRGVDDWKTRSSLRTVSYITKEVVDLDRLRMCRLSINFGVERFEARGILGKAFQCIEKKLIPSLTESIKHLLKNCEVDEAWFSDVPDDFVEKYVSGAIIRVNSLNLSTLSDKSFREILQSVSGATLIDLYVDPGYGHNIDYSILADPKYSKIQKYQIRTTDCWELVFLMATIFTRNDSDVGCILILDCEHGEDVLELFEDQFKSHIIPKPDGEAVEQYHGYSRMKTKNPLKHLFLSFVDEFGENLLLRVIPATIPSNHV